MTDKLTDNDRQRIEQEASGLPTRPMIAGFKQGAEYATTYEREKQTIPKPCHFCGGNGFIIGYENSSRECKYCNGSGYITENIECLSLPECYAASKKIEALEAERSEVRNKVIEEMMDKFKSMPGLNLDLDDVVQYLNSLKTK